MKIFSLVILPVITVLLNGGCFSADNNYLKPEDFAVRLEQAGIKVSSVRPLPGAPFKACTFLGEPLLLMIP